MPRITDQTTWPDKLQPVRPVRLYTQVVSQILALVAAGELVVGDKLPPERELATRLLVSRASLREALSALAVFGTIEIKPGNGIYITDTARNPMFGEADTITEAAGPLEILEAREIWEPTVARIAAQRRTDGDLIEMGALNSCLQQELLQGREGWSADWGFHEALGRATRNLSIGKVTVGFSEQMNGPIWALMRARNLEHRSSLARYAEDHRKILVEVAARSPDGAEAAMRQHFRHIMTDLES